MLGLPDDITACLFDLDGVLTKTAEVHARAWKQIFDGFLEKRGEKPFDLAHDYDEYVDGKPRLDGVRDFLASRGIELPEGSPDDPPGRRDGRRAGQRQERAGPAPHPRAAASRPTRARCATCRPRAKPACAGPWCPRATTATTCSWRPGSRTCSRSASTASSPRSATCAASRRPTPSSRRRASSASRPAHAAVFEDALAGVQAGHDGGFGCVVGVDRAGQRDALLAHGASWWSTTSPSCCDRPAALLGRAVGGHRGASSTSACWPRPSRSSRSPTATSGCGPTSTRASRTGCPGPT